MKWYWKPSTQVFIPMIYWLMHYVKKGKSHNWLAHFISKLYTWEVLWLFRELGPFVWKLNLRLYLSCRSEWVVLQGVVRWQYSDLLRLFEYGGLPPEANYLFLGDYVDRGKQSLETICLLLAYKIKYPENFFLLRGNHECASINRIYGFYDECKRRFNVRLWKTFTECFNCLPVAALIDEKILCMHGGLSPDLLNPDFGCGLEEGK